MATDKENAISKFYEAIGIAKSSKEGLTDLAILSAFYDAMEDYERALQVYIVNKLDDVFEDYKEIE